MSEDGQSSHSAPSSYNAANRGPLPISLYGLFSNKALQFHTEVADPVRLDRVSQSSISIPNTEVSCQLNTLQSKSTRSGIARLFVESSGSRVTHFTMPSSV